jgi:uncharacterized protein
MASPVVFFQIGTRDGEAAKRFFGELFGWEFGEGGGGSYVASIDPGGPADFDPKGALMEVSAGREPYVSLFVRVEDLSATLQRAFELGANEVVAPTRTATGADLALIRTPEGLVFGIVQA